ncbi:MAG: hypothetical protein LBQ58_11330 [Synergistaceae bacterium]|jgi:hypothetical protein|nr:hypothetical protein [Synergistaceae bacterium]
MKRSIWLLWVVLALMAFAAITGGCGGGGDSGENYADDPSDTVTVEPVIYYPGEDVVVVSKVIGASGGTIEAGNTGAPIDGVKVSFPVGALQSDTEIRLGYNTGSMTPNNGTWSGSAIMLEGDGVSDFGAPVEITVPSTAAYGIIVPYYVEESGRISPCQLINIDTLEQTATFVTFHASNYLTIIPIDFNGTHSAFWDFSPSSDGFRIENFRSDLTPDGSCLGMSCFAIWYYENERENGKLNDRFKNDAQQQYIAAHSHVRLNDDETWLRFEKAFEAQHFVMRRLTQNILSNSGPVMIYMNKGGTGKDASNAHQVVAFGFEIDRNDDVNFYIYDPNYKGERRSIHYNDRTGKFDAYDGRDYFQWFGRGSVDLSGILRPIMNEALANL